MTASENSARNVYEQMGSRLANAAVVTDLEKE